MTRYSYKAIKRKGDITPKSAFGKLIYSHDRVANRYGLAAAWELPAGYTIEEDFLCAASGG